MIRRLTLCGLLLLAPLALTLNGCRLEDQGVGTPVNPKTVVEILAEQQEFSTLVSAVRRAGLVDTLNNRSGQFTVFAPDNAAFAAAGLTPEAIEMTDVATLRSVLLYHLVSGQRFAADVVPGTLPTLNRNRPFLFVSTGPTLNGNTTITQPNLRAVNGLIHRIGRVITLPEGTLTSIVERDYPLLAAALSRAGLTQTLAEIDRDQQGHTLFAPTDSAFRAFGINSEADLSNIPAADLADLLLYHVRVGVLPAAGLDSIRYVMANGRPAFGTIATVSLNNRTPYRFLNGRARLLNRTTLASNGVLNPITNVITPPSTRPAREIIANEPDLSLLSAAFERLETEGQENLLALPANALESGEGQVYTIIAPINSAFTRIFNVTTPADLDALPIDSLRRLLRTHIIEQRRFSAGISNTTLPTLDARFRVNPVTGEAERSSRTLISSITANLLTGDLRLRAAGNVNPINGVDARIARFVQRDILASDAIIHKVDLPLIPR